MWLFYVFLLLLIVGIIALSISFMTRGEDRALARVVTVVVGLIALICLFFASWTQVGTKNLGVPLAFGHPSGHYGNGFHWKKPWTTIKQITNAVQTDTYASDGYDGSKQGGAVDKCIKVRITRQATACVNVSIRWQIKGDSIDYLIRNFKNNEAITDNLVLRDLQQAMNESFYNYDALGIDSNGNSTNQPLSAVGQPNLSDTVTNVMRTDIGSIVDVQSVLIPLLNFDDATQGRINQIQQQIAATRVSVQQKATNDAQAIANRALAASVSNAPGVLESKCLDILKELVDKGRDLPAGFSCRGSGSPVAIGVK